MNVDALAYDAASRAVHAVGFDPPASCGHILTSGAAAVGLCQLHPDQLMCPTCAQAHVDGHGIELARTCNACGSLSADVRPTMRDFTARYDQHNNVRVVLLGWHLCDPCVAVLAEQIRQEASHG